MIIAAAPVVADAARAMRAALQAMLASYGPPDAVASLCDYPAGHAITLARAAIAQAEAAGITAHPPTRSPPGRH